MTRARTADVTRARSAGPACVAGSAWTVSTSDAGSLHVQAGPGALDPPALLAWLSRGCTTAVPVRQGFVAVLVGPDGTVTAAASPRAEVTALYAFDHGRLCLATHPADLAEGRGHRPSLSVSKLADLVAMHDDPSTTVFTEVDRLPLGHVLHWRPGDSAPMVRPWFRPSTEPDDGIDPSRAPTLMRTAVREAVAASLPAAGDVAATLSGGLDSSMVVGTAADLLRSSGRLVHACTHVPLPGVVAAGIWEPDDGPYAERMAAQMPGLTWEPLVNTARVSPFDVLRTSFAEDWTPVVNPANQVWLRAARQLAGRVGSPVLLTGASGNGPFSRGGAGALRSLAAARRYAALGRHVRTARRSGASWGVAARPALRALAPGLDHAVSWRPGRRSNDASPWGGVLPVRAELLSEAGRDSLVRLSGTARPSRNAWVEFVADNRSLMTRPPGPVWWSDPLSDPEVISLALRLPEEAWLVGGRSRGLAREAAQGVVPDEIRLRQTRGGQSHDLGLWLEGRGDHLAELYEQVAASPTAQQFLDLPKLREACRVPPVGVDALRWEVGYGRALGYGLFAAWYESEVLTRS